MHSLCVKQQHLIQELVLQKCLKSSTGSWQLQGTTHVNLPNWVLMLSIEYETKPRVGVLEIAAFTSRSNNSHKSECQALSVAKPWQAQAYSMKTSTSLFSLFMQMWVLCSSSQTPWYTPPLQCEYPSPAHSLNAHLKLPHSLAVLRVQAHTPSCEQGGCLTQLSSQLIHHSFIAPLNCKETPLTSSA